MLSLRTALVPRKSGTLGFVCTKVRDCVELPAPFSVISASWLQSDFSFLGLLVFSDSFTPLEKSPWGGIFWFVPQSGFLCSNSPFTACTPLVSMLSLLLPYTLWTCYGIFLPLLSSKSIIPTQSIMLISLLFLSACPLLSDVLLWVAVRFILFLKPRNNFPDEKCLI